MAPDGQRSTDHRRKDKRMKRYATLICLLALAAGARCQTAQADEETTSRIDELMRSYERQGMFSGAVLAADGGEIVYEGAFGDANRELKVPNAVDTRFRIASISKPFTQILVLQQVEDGALELDGTIADYLPRYEGIAADRITIEQLLTHSSGIVGEWAVPELERVERVHHSRDELLEHIAGYTLWFEPGSRAGYSNFAYSLLALIVEEVSGRSYADLLEERICAPAGMENTVIDVTTQLIERRAAGYHYHEERGLENAPFIEMSFVYGYGHLLSTVRDLYLWDRALRDGEFLSEDYTDLVLEFATARDPIGAPEREVDVVRFGGSINGFLCSTHSYTQDERIVVVLSNARDRSEDVLPSTFTVARNIAAVLYGLEYERPTRPATGE
jgi:CubicO group peptidase (beta-lactamase class C family)